MKTLGLIGGMSWESTVTYYRLLNEGVREALGGLHSAKLIIHSIDFADLAEMQREGRWDDAGALLAEAARSLELAGAEALMIGANTMHCVADEVRNAISIPLLHVADATGEALVADGRRRVALLGTAFTMEQDFYRSHLENKYGLDILIPEPADRALVHQVIYEELCVGQFKPESRDAYLEIINRLSLAGAEAVILGCTEIGLLVSPDQSILPLYDTTAIHGNYALQWALS